MKALVWPVATYGCESWTLRKNEETGLHAFEIKGLRKILHVSWKTNEETRELPGERNNARNNTRCMQARKATHGLDGQHQDVDRTVCGRVNQNDRGQGQIESMSMVWPNLLSRMAKEQNRTGPSQSWDIV